MIIQNKLDGTVSTVAGSGSASYANGIGTVAGFYNPAAVSVDSGGMVWVAEPTRIKTISSVGMLVSQLLWLINLCYGCNGIF